MGSITSASTAWTTYNKPSQIVEGATTLTFSYGADRRRFKQVSSGGLTTLYVGGGLFEKRTRGTATTEVHHIQVQGRAVAVYTSLSSTTQSVRYLHGDHLGSIVLVTDEDGDVEGSRYSFDAFGRRRNGANWTDTLTTLTNPDTTRGYTGHEMLDAVDIVHMNGRIYDPFLGRVLSPDPYVQAPFDMQSFNRYTYVFNNPLSLTDPSGFLADDGYYVFDSGWTVDVVFHPGADGLGTFEVIRGIATRATWVPGSGNRGGRQAGGVGGGGGYYDGGGGGDGGGSYVASGWNSDAGDSTTQATSWWTRTVSTLTRWHYEGRSEKNVGLPPTAEDARAGGWTLLPAEQSEYHNDGIGLPEQKFISQDGREVVYYGDTGDLVTDPMYAGTYNYVNPGVRPENWYDAPGWVVYGARMVGHAVVDVAPYCVGGNDREGAGPSCF